MKDTVTLYRPMNKAELDLIKETDWKKFPPRLDFQPFFYPVTNLVYARQINKWNLDRYGEGFIVEFDISKGYLKNYELKTVGDKDVATEYWIPSEKLEEFNNNIKDRIRLRVTQRVIKNTHLIHEVDTK